MKKNNKFILLAALFAATTLHAETSFEIGLSTGYKHIKETWSQEMTIGDVAAGTHTTAASGAVGTPTQLFHGTALPTAGQKVARIYSANTVTPGQQNFLEIPLQSKTQFTDSFLMVSLPLQMRMDRFALKLELGYGFGLSSKIKNQENESEWERVDKNDEERINKKSSLFEASLKASYDFNINDTFKISPFIGYEIQSLKRKLKTDAIVDSTITENQSKIGNSLFNLLAPHSNNSKKNTPVIGVDFKFAPSETLNLVFNVAYAMPSVYTNGVLDYTNLFTVLGGYKDIRDGINSITLKDSFTLKNANKKRANQIRFGFDLNWMVTNAWTLNFYANAKMLKATKTADYDKQFQGHFPETGATSSGGQIGRAHV